MDPKEYTGVEWDALYKQLSQKELRKALKSGYGIVARKAKKIADASLLQNGPKVSVNQSDWAKAIRVRVYDRGGGFVVTTKPHKGKGFHTNRRGLQKPVVMWAEDGTKDRVRFRKWQGLSTGAMPEYGFIAKVEDEMIAVVNDQLGPIIMKVLDKAVKKAGF